VRSEDEKRVAALDAGLRRVCTPKAKTGKLEVAPEIYQQWKKGGMERKLLLDQFIAAGANKAAFIKRIEHIRSRSRTSTLTVKSGWYSKDAMKKIRAPQFGLRDKYQKKLKEYWVDVATEGAFQKSSEETFKETLMGEGEADDVTVGGVNPGEPVDGSSGESSAGEDDSEDDADSGAGRARKAGRGKGNGGKTSIEEEKALEAVENVGAVMTNILRTQGKMDDLCKKLRDLGSEDAKKSETTIKKHVAEIMKLHDQMADVKSYFDGHGAMSPEKTSELQKLVQAVETACSRAVMEDTKLKRTLLRPKTSQTKPPQEAVPAKSGGKGPSSKGGGKSKAKASMADLQWDGTVDPPPAKRSKSGPAAKAVAKAVGCGAAWLSLSCGYWQGNLLLLFVVIRLISEQLLQATSVRFEGFVKNLVVIGKRDTRLFFGFCFLARDSEADRLASTGHETRLGQTLVKHNFLAKVDVSYVDVFLKKSHPVLAIRDFVAGLSAEDHMTTLFHGHEAADYARFWAHWQKVQPDHPVYEVHAGRLGQVVPIWIHADEGTSQKKRGLMVLSWQPLLGQGTQRQPNSSLNFLGPSVSTRCLFSVMSTQLYNTASKKKRLMALADVFAQNLRDCFERPIEISWNGEQEQIYLSCLGMKGDWPAQIKLGGLRRHHLRDTWSTDAGAGICHYCMGGMKGHPWHDLSFANMLAMRQDAPPAWSKPTGLIQHVPHSVLQEPYFFRIDLFHLMHKGVLADIAANAIVSQLALHFLVSIMVSCSDHELFGCTSLDQTMAYLYEDARQFCQAQGLELHMSWFKGNDTTSLCKYMQWKLKDVHADMTGSDKLYFAEIASLLSSGNEFMHRLYHAGLWLSRSDRDKIIAAGDKLVDSFMLLAQLAYNSDICRWKVQTKFHMFGELVFSLKMDRTRGCRSLSPLSYSTQVDEDFIGKICTASRYVSSRTLHEKTIHRYLLKLKQCWE
ncbi:unnamed protein product, partial [Symbiodinium sp. CCMP2456]